MVFLVFWLSFHATFAAGAYEPVVEHHMYNHALVASRMDFGELSKAYGSERIHVLDDYCQGAWFARGGFVSGKNRGMHVLFGTSLAQRRIWNSQYTENCSTAKYVVHRLPSNGIGSVLHVASAGLALAMQLGRIYVEQADTSNFWLQGTFCNDSGTMDGCYFEPWSNCRSHEALPIDADYDVGVDQSHLRTIALHGNEYQVRTLVPNIFHKLLEADDLIPHESWYYWWRAQAIAFLVRPNGAVLTELEARRAKVFGRSELPPGTISVHVRHGDKHIEAQEIPNEAYEKEANYLRARFPDLLSSSIYLSTEDPGTVDFFTEARSWSVGFMLVERKPDKSKSTTEYAQQFGPTEEMLNSLLSLQLALEADAWVGTLSSNWCRLIDELRSTVYCKADRPFSDPAVKKQRWELHW